MKDPWREFVDADFGPDTDVPLVLYLRGSRNVSGLYLALAVGWVVFLGLWTFSVTVGAGQPLGRLGTVLLIAAMVLIFPLVFVILSAHRYARREFGIRVSHSRSASSVWDGKALGTALAQLGLAPKLRYIQVAATIAFAGAWVWAMARSI